ncbi:hypothetical protein TIFTF001_022361 [Ficus carica]|uniref:Uncharacterized protein n=1 Tax=Ficus carica TaxID=3494 RepID=A0AA88AII6_FICCA|nr:hypothetical protein TIFTF001_022361 [Ficus carica]
MLPSTPTRPSPSPLSPSPTAATALSSQQGHLEKRCDSFASEKSKVRSRPKTLSSATVRSTSQPIEFRCWTGQSILVWSTGRRQIACRSLFDPTSPVLILGTVHLYTFPDWSDLRVAFSAWRVLGAPSAEQILKPSLSKPSTLGTEYRTGLAPTSIPGPYSASNTGLGIGHVDDPPTADITHLLVSPVKSPPAANHSDGHCCPFTSDTHGTLSLTVQGLGPRGVHLLGQ